MRDSRGGGCSCLGLFGFGKREPVLGREANAPDVSGQLQFQGDLEELADGARTLNPGDAPANGASRLARLRMGHFERHPHIFKDVMFGLITTAVAVDNQRGSAFVERSTQGVDTSNRQKHGLYNARAAA